MRLHGETKHEAGYKGNLIIKVMINSLMSRLSINYFVTGHLARFCSLTEQHSCRCNSKLAPQKKKKSKKFTQFRPHLNKTEINPSLQDFDLNPKEYIRHTALIFKHY